MGASPKMCIRTDVHFWVAQNPSKLFLKGFYPFINLVDYAFKI